MYKVILVTSLSETVVSMQQFPSCSCSTCAIFCYYSLVVLQSYFLVSFFMCVAFWRTEVQAVFSTWEENVSRRVRQFWHHRKILNQPSDTVQFSEKIDQEERCFWCSWIQGKIVLTVNSVGVDNAVYSDLLIQYWKMVHWMNELLHTAT
jgi:hypothetical protein